MPLFLLSIIDQNKYDDSGDDGPYTRLVEAKEEDQIYTFLANVINKTKGVHEDKFLGCFLSRLQQWRRLNEEDENEEEQTQTTAVSSDITAEEIKYLITNSHTGLHWGGVREGLIYDIFYESASTKLRVDKCEDAFQC